MATLHQQLESLASAFANDVLAALRSASLEEIVGEQSAAHRVSDGARPSAGRPAARRGGARRAAARATKPTATRSSAPGKPAFAKSGRLMRRSPEAITKEVERIVSLLKKHKEGLRAEKIQAALGMRRKELPKPLAEGLAKKRLKKKGEKRATLYYAA